MSRTEEKMVEAEAYELLLKGFKSKLKEKVPAFVKRVAPVYKVLDWKWCFRDSTERVPTECDIVARLRDLINRLTYEYKTCSGGGLYVFANKCDGLCIEGGMGMEIEEYMCLGMIDVL